MSHPPKSHVCPNCRKRAAPPPENRFHPFCSERCKAIDLSRWFGGGYRVAGEELGPGEIGEAEVAEAGRGLSSEDLDGSPVDAPPPRRRRH
jgi:endogenous inhibitor of DNA gyrase (YacG/DUF329 family)